MILISCARLQSLRSVLSYYLINSNFFKITLLRYNKLFMRILKKDRIARFINILILSIISYFYRIPLSLSFSFFQYREITFPILTIFVRPTQRSKSPFLYFWITLYRPVADSSYLFLTSFHYVGVPNACTMIIAFPWSSRLDRDRPRDVSRSSARRGREYRRRSVLVSRFGPRAPRSLSSSENCTRRWRAHHTCFSDDEQLYNKEREREILAFERISMNID